MRNARPETEALWYMSIASKEHRALLKHPVISSFLWMKWQRIRSFYYLRLIHYIIFVLLLTALIFFDYGGCTLYESITSANGTETNENERNCPTDNHLDTVVLKIVVGLFVLYLAIEELVQIGVSFKRYFVTPENFIQLVIIVLSAILVLDETISWENRRHVAALTILLTWSECIIMFSQHPRRSRGARRCSHPRRSRGTRQQ